eukprot:symbB.v1.2.017033.t1/scaffold1285.1/size129168/12
MACSVCLNPGMAALDAGRFAMSESATARLELEGGENAALEMPAKLPPELEGHLSAEDYEYVKSQFQRLFNHFSRQQTVQLIGFCVIVVIFIMQGCFFAYMATSSPGTSSLSSLMWGCLVLIVIVLFGWCAWGGWEFSKPTSKIIFTKHGHLAREICQDLHTRYHNVRWTLEAEPSRNADNPDNPNTLVLYAKVKEVPVQLAPSAGAALPVVAAVVVGAEESLPEPQPVHPEGPKFCGQCGTKRSNPGAFCPNCGARL